MKKEKENCGKKIRIIMETDYSVSYPEFFEMIFYGATVMATSKTYPPKITIEATLPMRKIIKQPSLEISLKSSEPTLVEYKTYPACKKAVLIKDSGNMELMSKREQSGRTGKFDIKDRNWIFYKSWYEFDFNKFLEKVRPKLKELEITENELLDELKK